MRSHSLPTGFLLLVTALGACRNDGGNVTADQGNPGPTGLLAAKAIIAQADGSYMLTCLDDKQESRSRSEIEENKVCGAAAPANPPADNGGGQPPSGNTGIALHFFEKSAFKSGLMDCTARENSGQPCVEGTEKCTQEAGSSLSILGVAVATDRAYDHIQVTAPKSASCQIETGYVYFRHLKFDLVLGRAADVSKAGGSATETCNLPAGTRLAVHNVTYNSAAGVINFLLTTQGEGCLAGFSSDILQISKDDLDLTSDPLKTFLSGQ